MRDRKKKKVFKKNYRQQLRVGKVALSFTAIFLMLSFSLFFLSQSNQATMRGYDISALETKKDELVAEREKLEVEAARLKSIQDIQDGVEKTNMVPSKKLNYVSTSSGVAVNR